VGVCVCVSQLPSVAGGSGGGCKNSSRRNVDRFCVVAGEHKIHI
jgi:hypothetical protein